MNLVPEIGVKRFGLFSKLSADQELKSRNGEKASILDTTQRPDQNGM